MLQIEKIKSLPLVLKVALVASLGLFAFDTALFFILVFSGSYKIDPGIATLCGAVIGLSVVAWQTRAGFQNLIRSQENQAELERDGRLHKAEIEESAKASEERRERAYLLSALRAEIVYLMGLAYDAERVSTGLKESYEQHEKRGVAPYVKTTIPRESFDAPIFKANIANLGLLGTSLGADVITVLSFADGKSKDFFSEGSMTMKFVADLYETHALTLKHWRQDLYHVAMRIRATEEGTPDPGTLGATRAKRRAE